MAQVTLKSKVNLDKLTRLQLDKALDSELYDYGRGVLRSIIDKYYSKKTDEGKKEDTGVFKNFGRARYGWKYKVRTRKTGDDVKGTIVFYNDAFSNFNQERIVSPRNGKFLAVPMPSILNEPKWKKKFQAKSARDIDRYFETFLFKNKNGTMFVVNKEKFREDPTDDSAYLYVLKDKIVIPAYTKNLPTFAKTKMDLLKPALERAIAQRLSR